MRLLQFFTLFVLFFVFSFRNYVGNTHVCLNTSLPTILPPSSEASYGFHDSNVFTKRAVFMESTTFKLLIFILWLIFLQCQAWLHICSNTYYVPFKTNLNLFKKIKTTFYTNVHGIPRLAYLRCSFLVNVKQISYPCFLLSCHQTLYLFVVLNLSIYSLNSKNPYRPHYFLSL